MHLPLRDRGDASPGRCGRKILTSARWRRHRPRSASRSALANTPCHPARERTPRASPSVVMSPARPRRRASRRRRRVVCAMAQRAPARPPPHGSWRDPRQRRLEAETHVFAASRAADVVPGAESGQRRALFCRGAVHALEHEVDEPRHVRGVDARVGMRIATTPSSSRSPWLRCRDPRSLPCGRSRNRAAR